MFAGAFFFVVLRGADAQKGAQQSADHRRSLGHLVRVGPAPDGSEADVSGGEGGDHNHGDPFQDVVQTVIEFHFVPPCG